MKTIWYRLIIAVFFLACLAPLAGLLIAGPAEPAANEAAAPAPRVFGYDGSFNLDLPDELRDYVGKGFFPRVAAITAWDALCATLFHTSANDDVLLGPDGWLFYGAAVNDIAGAGQMTDREIWCCARSLALMQEYAASRGARFLFVSPCGKYTLYPEHAPAYVTVAAGSNRERLYAALDEMGVANVDLYGPFTAVDEALYWRWDSHWNGRGAALAADAILSAAGLPSDWFGGAFIEQDGHTGDLYAMLYPTGTATEADYAPASGFGFSYTSDFRSTDDMTITTENAGADGALLLFRDSSGRSLYPYLADRFGSAYITRMNSYRLDLIDETGATVVVAELAERTLDYLLKYPAVYPSPVRDAAVLAGMEAVESEVSVGAADIAPDGCAAVTGTLPDAAVDSPVYVLADGVVYEAIPGADGFRAYLPAGTAADGLAVYVRR